MKLGINSACDLRAVSLLPPRSGGGGGRASAPPASYSASAAGHRPQVVLSQQQPFSLGIGGGVDASLLHLKQPRPSESEASVDQILNRPTPARHQGFGLHSDSSKRMPSLPPSSGSRAQEEHQQQPAMISYSTRHGWNPSPTDTRCRVNEHAEHRFQQLSGSVHKVGMVLDSVQTDLIQLNRAVKEASLDSGSVQQKVDLLEDSLQKIIKGQNNLKILAEGSTKGNPDLLNVLNSRTSKFNEMSLIVSVCPGQVQADVRQLHGDIFRVLTKDMEGVVRDIRSLNTRPTAMQMLQDQSYSPSERPQRNQYIEANGSPLMNQTPAANGSPMINHTPVGRRSQRNQTPAANGRPQSDGTPGINGKLQTEEMPATKPLPAHSTYATRAAVLKPNVEQGKVKAAHMVGTSYRLAPTHKEVLNQKVNPKEPTKKEPVRIIIGSDNDREGLTSQVILDTAPADLMKEADSELGLRLVWRTRKRRTRSETLSIDDATLLSGERKKRRKEPGPEAKKDEAVHVAEAVPAKRARRFNIKYDASQWITC